MKLLNITPAKRKSLLVLPLIVVPGLCLIFFALGGGRGARFSSGSVPFGLNPELPRASEGRALLNKKLQYEEAERDSLRKAQYRLQDPYRRDSQASSPAAAPGLPAKPIVVPDRRADQVLAQLQRLKEAMRQPAPVSPGPSMSSLSPLSSAFPSGTAGHYQGVRPSAMGDDTVGDGRIGQLNAMLDKVMRIQHPWAVRAQAVGPVNVDEVVPADSGVNAISAVIADNQLLVAGSTVALRITDSIRVNGQTLPAGQLIYGTVSIANDRMLVHVTALRLDRSLYAIDLQAYDLDGIAGVHIPGVLSRDVAKQSADQGVSSLNVLTADPSLGAQAADAGIQMAKSFASRKVRQIRVGVPAGYQLLLRDAHARTFRRRDLVARPVSAAFSVAAPDFNPTGDIIGSCRNEGVGLSLKGVWLLDGRLWFGLEYTNASAISYVPSYARWFIRNKRQVRRTAMQEVPLEPVYTPEAKAVAQDSTVDSWTGFVPFSLPKDKELILEVGEKGEGRTLTLRIKHTAILDAKTKRP